MNSGRYTSQAFLSQPHADLVRRSCCCFYPTSSPAKKCQCSVMYREYCLGHSANMYKKEHNTLLDVVHLTPKTWDTRFIALSDIKPFTTFPALVLKTICISLDSFFRSWLPWPLPRMVTTTTLATTMITMPLEPPALRLPMVECARVCCVFPH